MIPLPAPPRETCGPSAPFPLPRGRAPPRAELRVGPWRGCGCCCCWAARWPRAAPSTWTWSARPSTRAPRAATSASPWTSSLPTHPRKCPVPGGRPAPAGAAAPRGGGPVLAAPLRLWRGAGGAVVESGVVPARCESPASPEEDADEEGDAGAGRSPWCQQPSCCP